MAEIVVTQDEQAMRRRARRRLVGAVAIALTSVVVLPMLFDSEPKPLGPEVDIRIPAQDSPFETVPSPTPSTHLNPTTSQPEEKPAEATRPPSPAASRTDTDHAADSRPEDKPPIAAAPVLEKAKPRPETKPIPVTKPKTEEKAAAKPRLKPDTPFSSQGYFLQLGAFTSEANARQLSDKASAAGFKVALVGANGQFRVRVGPIPEQQKALDMQNRLKAKGFSPVLLGP